MALHKLKKLVRRKKRRGRGIAGGGAKSGRGMKGQKARAGYSSKAGFEGGQTPLYQRLPKGRGTKQVFRSQAKKPLTIKTGQVEKLAVKNILGLGALMKAGLLASRYQQVKLINGGEVKEKVTVRVHQATAGAVKTIEQAGGKVELITASKNKKE